MIAAIKKGQYFKGFIDYNEKKVDRGVAKLLDNTTFANNRIAYNQLFLNICDERKIQGKRKGNNIDASKTQAVHISLNFPIMPNKELTDEFLKDYAATYMNSMGYNNHPYLLYRHYDAKHTHLHIVTSRYDWESKKLSTTQDWKKSNSVSLKLSEQYDLPKYSDYSRSKDAEKKCLNVINKHKYSIQNSVKIALNKPFYSKGLAHYLTPEESVKIKASALSNDDIFALLGEDRAANLMNYLDSRKLFNPLIKEQLHGAIKESLASSSDLNSYVNALKSKGVYVREVTDQKTTSTVFVYGLGGKYFNDTSLNPACRFSSVKKSFQKNVVPLNKPLLNFSENEQKAFLQKRINYILSANKSINSYNSLQTALNKDNIELITYQNSGGIYGISFRSNNVLNPVLFKGSDIGVSVNKLNFLFSISKVESDVSNGLVNSGIQSGSVTKEFVNAPQVPVSNFVPVVSFSSLSVFEGMGKMGKLPEQDLNDLARKKKKKKKPRII